MASAVISDEVAGEIDYCVSRLADFDKEAGEVVIMHFLLRRSMNKVARESEMNHHKAAVLLNARAVSAVSTRSVGLVRLFRSPSEPGMNNPMPTNSSVASLLI